MKSLFIFRRDFRLTDNLGFIKCYMESDEIIPIFIFTPEQAEKDKNKYFSNNAFQFMIESLEELDNDIRDKTKNKSHLHYYYGDNITVLQDINYNYNTIYFNMDYTVYARKRDNDISIFCKEQNINCFMIEDYLLLPINSYLKEDGSPYQKYTPFKNNAKKINVSHSHAKHTEYKKLSKINSSKFKFPEYVKNPNVITHGGRKNALDILKNIKIFSHYDKERNNLITPTTHMSSYIKFGCVSIREVYEKFKINQTLIDQLYWREFYYYLAYYIPRVLEGKSLKEKYDKIKWKNDPKIFKAWTLGMTGFPSVDAGMRELNETGFMHNRARLITSGILIKILNCDWRLGEKYFAQKLSDYDPIVNNGNWQWSSGSGADSQPYFRILSPWKQAIDNDPECLYIKKWIPELRDIPNKDILHWDETYMKYKISYPKPIVDYKFMREEIIKIYKEGFNYI